MLEDVITVLAGMEQFQGIPRHGLMRLAQAGRLRRFRKDEVIIPRGEKHRTLHIVLSGRVLSERSHPDIIDLSVRREFGPGEAATRVTVAGPGLLTEIIVAMEDSETVEFDLPALALMALRFADCSGSLLTALMGSPSHVRRLARQLWPPLDERGARTSTDAGADGAERGTGDPRPPGR